MGIKKMKKLCPSCNQKLLVPILYKDIRVTCPSCKYAFIEPKTRTNKFNDTKINNDIIDFKVQVTKKISQNSFYILDLPSSSKSYEIDNQGDKILKRIKLGLNIQLKNECPGLTTPKVVEETLNKAVATINNLEKRLEERFFWFFNPCLMLDTLKEENMWKRAINYSRNDSSLIKHDAALLALIYLSSRDSSVIETDKWQTMVEMWHDVINDRRFWSDLELIESESGFSAIAKTHRFQQNIFDKVLEYSLVSISSTALQRQELTVFERAIDVLSSEVLDDICFPTKKKVLRLGEDKLNTLLKDIKVYQKKMIYDHKHFSSNEDNCKEAYKAYLEQIEPLLVSLFLFIDHTNIQGIRIREICSDFLHRLTIDYSWANQHDDAKQLVQKGLALSFDTAIMPRLKKIQRDMGELNKNKAGSTISFHSKIHELLLFNPFRLLDLSANANWADINNAIKKLELKLLFEFENNLTWDLKILPSYNIDEDLIANIRNQIGSVEKQIEFMLFWFVYREKSLMSINPQELLETSFQYYNKSSNHKKMDFALLALITLFMQDKKIQHVKDWIRLFPLWMQVFDEDTCKSIEHNYYHGFSQQLSTTDIIEKKVNRDKRVIFTDLSENWSTHSSNGLMILGFNLLLDMFFEQIENAIEIDGITALERALEILSEMKWSPVGLSKVYYKLFSLAKKDIKKRLDLFKEKLVHQEGSKENAVTNPVAEYKEKIAPYYKRFISYCKEHNMDDSEIQKLVVEYLCIISIYIKQLSQKDALDLLQQAQIVAEGRVELNNQIHSLIKEFKGDCTSNQQKDEDKMNKAEGKDEKKNQSNEETYTHNKNILVILAIITFLIALGLFLSQ